MNRFALASVAALALSAFAGCASAPATSTTTTTAADVAAPAARESTPRQTPHETATFPGETPKGDLTCRVNSIQEGNIELYLSWGNDGAKGTLRRRAPSGMITETKVHAERVQGAIVADDVLSMDLVTHAAMVREHKGKRYIRLGDAKQGWLACD